METHIDYPLKESIGDDFWLTDEELVEAFAEASLRPDDSEWTPESDTLESPFCP